MLPRARCDHLARIKRFTASGLFLHTDRCQAILRPSIKSAKERLFLPGSNDDEDTADLLDNHSTSRDPTSYLNESCSDAAPDPAVDQFSTNSQNIIQPASSQWFRDDANTHRILLGGGSGLTTLPRNTRRPTPSTIRRNNSYALSPSRITGFVRRSGPYVQDHSTIDDSKIHPHSLASHGGNFPVTSGINSNPSVDPGDTVDDPLAEFDRWLASGAVEILPE